MGRKNFTCEVAPVDFRALLHGTDVGADGASRAAPPGRPPPAAGTSAHSGPDLEKEAGCRSEEKRLSHVASKSTLSCSLPAR